MISLLANLFRNTGFMCAQICQKGVHEMYTWPLLLIAQMLSRTLPLPHAFFRSFNRIIVGPAFLLAQPVLFLVHFKITGFRTMSPLSAWHKNMPILHPPFFEKILFNFRTLNFCDELWSKTLAFSLFWQFSYLTKLCASYWTFYLNKDPSCLYIFNIFIIFHINSVY